MPNPASELKLPIREVRRTGVLQREDPVAVEEPLEVRLIFGLESQRQMRRLTVTMRTPGNDYDLVMGLLFSEGIIDRQEDVDSIEFSGVTADGHLHQNTAKVQLSSSRVFDPLQLQRNFFANSSCGVCGKASIDSLERSGVQKPRSDLVIKPELIFSLADALRRKQDVFSSTGAIHAAGLCNGAGQLHLLREDIGRHNAVDKAIGAMLCQGRLPASDHILVVSGRAGFEIVQKSLAAGIPLMVAIGAPSSLAIATAVQFGMALVGFASDQRFNVYCDPQGLVSL